jgi:hypothetical protein
MSYTIQMKKEMKFSSGQQTSDYGFKMAGQLYQSQGVDRVDCVMVD